MITIDIIESDLEGKTFRRNGVEYFLCAIPTNKKPMLDVYADHYDMTGKSYTSVLSRMIIDTYFRVMEERNDNIACTGKPKRENADG